MTATAARRGVSAAFSAVAAAALVVFVVRGLSGGRAEAPVPTELRLGERLFRETRFAQAFAARSAGLPASDAGQATSCATCHLSDERVAEAECGIRAFCDFVKRSPLPPRGDGLATTVRNAPALREVAPPRTGAAFFHYDGQFTSVEELAAATLTGRSLGWLPGERAEALAHVARVVREDDGLDANALAHGGGGYAGLLASTSARGPGDAPLPPPFRIDALTASDEEVVGAVSRLLAHYVESLSLGRHGANAIPFRSPYDRFLEKNGLPARPDQGENDLAYARRLRAAVLTLARPVYVGAADGRFRTHAHPFRFDELERRGLLVFLAEPAPPGSAPAANAAQGGVSAGGIGSCISCHAPPSFTDFGFHNVGASQVEYDAVHGLGAFARLQVPGLAERNAAPRRFLPPSVRHPNAQGPFLSPPRRDAPERADLGLWNTFANPDVPGPQAALRAAIVARLALPPSTSDAALLPRTIGWMKTPTLRNLGHSAPYFHGGHVETLADAVQHYRAVAFSARAGLVRNAATELAGIDLALQDLVALAAFLQALDKDP